MNSRCSQCCAPPKGSREEPVFSPASGGFGQSLELISWLADVALPFLPLPSCDFSSVHLCLNYPLKNKDTSRIESSACANLVWPLLYITLQ